MRNLILAVLMLTLTSCGVQWHLSTTNHDPIYGPTIVVADDVEVDTLNYTQFKRKLRTDFSFRWDYANYMMNRPLSFYYRNYNSFLGPRYLGNVHDLWWNSHQYWTDWAFNYPFNSWYWDRWSRPNRWNWGYGGWYSNTWNNHWHGYGWNHWYGHDSWRWGNVWRNDNTYVRVNSRRGSSNVAVGGSSRGNSVIRNTDDGNRVIRRYDNPSRGRNNNVIIRNNNDNIQVNPPVNNNNSRGINNNRRYYTPPNINNNTNSRSIRSSSPPVINRGSSNISRGSSTSSRNSGGSGRGSRGNNN